MSDEITPKDTEKKHDTQRPLNSRSYLHRINLFMFLTTVIFIVIVYRLFNLQVLKSDFLSYQAVSNKRQIIRLPSYRGEIFLKDGKKLAENLSAYLIYLVPKNFPRKKHSPEEYRQAIDKIYRHFNITEKRILSVLRKSRINPYLPYLIKEKVSDQEIFFLAEHLDEFPYFIYEDSLVRSYPLESYYAHISGYVQKISAKELRNRSKFGYGPNSMVGKTGIEGYHDLELRGKDGYKVHIVDVKNRVKEEIFPEDGKPIPGKNLYLTIDPEIQAILHRTLQGLPGGAIVTKVETGEVLGLYSYPFYDPNVFAQKDRKRFKEYLEDKRNPFLNRVIQAQYPPSSIFKLMVSLAALDDPKVKVDNTFYYCEGKLVIGDSIFRCTSKHGRSNFLQAIAQSCNVFFYKLGIRISPQVIEEYSRTYFKFGQMSGIDLLYEKKGRIPSSKWKIENRGTFWWDGDTANLSIGQGFALTTVAQINTMTMAIANGGEAYQLHLVSQNESLDDKKMIDQNPTIFIQLPFSKKNIRYIQKSMRQVVKWGTARRIDNGKILIAGKTGTAQSIKGQENHAWFTGYAPYSSTDNPKIKEKQIAVTVLTEHGGSGSVYPANFVNAILQAIFLKRDPLVVIKEGLQLWKNQADQYEKWLAIRNEKKLPNSYFNSTIENTERTQLAP